ncbi:MAG: fluoride efflux transporter CrcB [Spirochaetaceae bacterium]|nr:fluoride efflux transporter CrcB [Spirochaetaceae bacterium]
MDYFYIVLGGGLGALARYVSISFISRLVKTPFPAGTLVVNIIGSFLIGILFSIFEKHRIPAEFRLFLTTGFLGAYTTFSTYSLETVRYFVDGNTKLAIINVVLSNAVCLIFTLIGMKFGKNF